MGVMKWRVDASFAVHPDMMRCHTGGGLSRAKGQFTERPPGKKSIAQKVEVIGLHEVLPQILWTRYFLEAQGYDVEESVIFQDNQSAILLAKNGRGSKTNATH
jgi:hypothetical protein